MLIAGRIEDPLLAQEMSDINHAAFGYKQIRDLSRYRIQQMMKDKRFAFYGAADRRGLMGFLLLDHVPAKYIEDPNEILIENFSVLPGAQGKGVGKTILDLVVNKLYLHASFNLCVNVNNKAVHLYEKFGFVSYGANHLVKCQSYIAMGLIRNYNTSPKLSTFSTIA